MPYRKSYKKKNAKRTYRPRKKVYRKKGITSFAVKKIVKMAIARNVENKNYQYWINGYNIYPSTAAGFNTGIFPCSPFGSYLQIDQGVGQGERIGNKIKIKNLSIKGFIVPKPFDAITNPAPMPVIIVMRFFILRQSPTQTPGSMGSFLQLGDTSANLQNDLTDVTAPYNEDAFKMFTRRMFKLGFASYDAASGTSGMQNHANNDFKMNCPFKINLTKYAIKNVIYNDTSVQPRTRGIFCSVQALNADGTSMSSSYIPATMTCQLALTYEDA